jgi:hypothetical protein
MKVTKRVQERTLKRQWGAFLIDAENPERAISEMFNVKSVDIDWDSGEVYLGAPVNIYMSEEQKASMLKFYGFNEERKSMKKKNTIIEVTEDVTINDEVILEKGDKVEVIESAKTEPTKESVTISERALKEDDYKKVLPEFIAFIDSAKEKGVGYLAQDLQFLFQDVQRRYLQSEESTLVSDLFFDLMGRLDDWTY